MRTASLEQPSFGRTIANRVDVESIQTFLMALIVPLPVVFIVGVPITRLRSSVGGATA
jgi:hypothetical protein